MKRYLDLVPISAKIHRKQSRMSIFCIVLAVFLVTTIFGMADMFIRSQILQAQMDGGNFHVGLRYVTDEDCALIAKRPAVKAAARYGVLNYRGEDGYTLSGKTAIIMGCDEPWFSDMMVDGIVEGRFPQTESEAMLTQSAKDRLGFQIGDIVMMDGPDGEKLTYIISGFCKDAIKTTSEDSIGVSITTDAFRSIYPAVKHETLEDYDSVCYVQFENPWNARQELQKLKADFGLSDEQVYENVKLMGLYGQSDSSKMMQIYAVAAVLFVLVLTTGVIMIASSLNSNVAQRTEFFGLMRCIGATPKQVIRLVRKEALLWCRLAIPIGIGVGIVVIWILCAVLRVLSPEYFAQMPAFGLSIPSILAGILMGLLTVLLAARSPAKKAARVSPLAAVSGNANGFQPAKKAANTRFFKVETALGIHHAKASKKNLILMVGSFALSIILFLSFTVTVDFMNHALTPLRPWTADLSIISPDNSLSVDSGILRELKEYPAVKTAYGRMFAYDLPMEGAVDLRKADLLTYEENQFGWAKEYLLEGSLDTVVNRPGTALVVYEPETTIQVGDTITLDIGGKAQQIQISGMLSTAPFGNANDGTVLLICSEDTFRQFTGTSDYTVIDIQLTNKATNEDVHAIQQMAGTSYTFSDERMSNSSVKGSYYSFCLFLYGFLVLIALITVFNIVNSVAMSVAARTKQYGAFRAIGLSSRQLKKMVVAEACVYTIIGSIIGTVLGLICNQKLFELLITSSWGDTWRIPWMELTIILFVTVLAVIFAVRGPVRKIHKMSIVDTISAQ